MTPLEMRDKPLSVLHAVYKKMKIMDWILKRPTFAYVLFRYIFKPLMLKGYNRLNRGIRFSFMVMGGGRISRGEIRASSKSYSARREALEELLDADKSGKPVVWVEWSVSRLILRGFDVLSLCPEGYMKIGFSIDRSVTHHFLDEAANEGILNEGCSSQKGAMGAMLLNQIPEPDAIIATSLPCDSGISVYQNMQYHTGAPMFVLDAPYDRGEKSLEFYGEQFGELIEFLEEKLNQTFDWEKFTSAVEDFNRFSHYLYEISEMGKNVPCPYYITSLTDGWELRSQYAGHPGSIEMSEILYDTVKKRMKSGRGIVKEEKVRILWWDVPVAFTSISPWLEEKYGAVTVTNFLTKYPQHVIDTSDRKKMLEGVALIDLYNGMSRQAHGSLDFITDELYDAVETYSPDCIMFIRHTGCRHGWAVSRIIRDTCKEIGLPSLFMSADIFDERECSEDEIREQIDVFLKSNGLV